APAERAKGAGRPAAGKASVAKARAALVDEQADAPPPDDEAEGLPAQADETVASADEPAQAPPSGQDIKDDPSTDDEAGADDASDVATRIAEVASQDPAAL